MPYPDTLNTLGDHIRKTRLDRGLYQKHVAKLFRGTTDSVACWENNRNQPSLSMVPRIIAFLGYNPNPDAQPDETLAEQIVRVRRVLGIRKKELVRQLGVDSRALAHWECGRRQPMPENRAKAETFLELSLLSEPKDILKGTSG